MAERFDHPIYRLPVRGLLRVHGAVHAAVSVVAGVRPLNHVVDTGVACFAWCSRVMTAMELERTDPRPRRRTDVGTWQWDAPAMHGVV
jgi:hypothetical protein